MQFVYSGRAQLLSRIYTAAAHGDLWEQHTEWGSLKSVFFIRNTAVISQDFSSHLHNSLRFKQIPDSLLAEKYSPRPYLPAPPSPSLLRIHSDPNVCLGFNDPTKLAKRVHQFCQISSCQMPLVGLTASLYVKPNRAHDNLITNHTGSIELQMWNCLQVEALAHSGLPLVLASVKLKSINSWGIIEYLTQKYFHFVVYNIIYRFRIAHCPLLNESPEVQTGKKMLHDRGGEAARGQKKPISSPSAGTRSQSITES